MRRVVSESRGGGGAATEPPGRNADPGRLGSAGPHPPYCRSRTRRRTTRRRAEIPAGPGRVQGKDRASLTWPKPSAPRNHRARRGARPVLESAGRHPHPTEPPRHGTTRPGAGRGSPVRPHRPSHGNRRGPGPEPRQVLDSARRPPTDPGRTQGEPRRTSSPERPYPPPTERPGADVPRPRSRPARPGPWKARSGAYTPGDGRRQRRATPSARAAAATAAVTAGATRSSNGDGMT